MLEGFPVPDFSSEDDPIAYTVPFYACRRQFLTDAEYDSLCTSQGIVIDQLSPIKCTGNSTVYSACSPSDGKKFAVKVTDHKNRMASEFDKRKQIRDSPYLLRSISLKESPTKSMLKMELCENGDLRNRKLSEDEIWKLIHDVSMALVIIHHDGWMHLDVSPGNILIGKRFFKLADFGTLAKVGEYEEGMEGAGPYVSPECLDYPTGYPVTQQTDILSFGLVLLEAVTDIPAPRGGSNGYVKIRNGEWKLGIPPYVCDCSEELIDVINSMLDHNPDNRPTSLDLCGIPRVVQSG
jgi:membrane-associated tyrosine/threonine-specific cdc2-inhibitory kinase